jgi:murein DD-endopeptidase MepM/ murein hydrolase activator NlpD
MSTPTGPIKSAAPGGGSFGIDWEDLTRYDDIIHQEADPVGWPIERIRATIAIESRGEPKAVQENNSNGWSYGLMQVVPFGVGWEGWNALVHEKALLQGKTLNSRREVVNALYDPAINIAVGVAILESFYVQHGTLDKAQSAFFIGRPDWSAGDTVNMTTGFQYRDALNALIAEQRAFAPPDPIAVIMGGPNYNVFFGYNKLGGNPSYYDYGAGHGLDGDAHTGYDITTTLGQLLYTPGDGVITCAGTGRGPGSWNTGCAAFADYYGKRAGRVEVMLDAGVSVILGHCSESLLPAGARVTAGQPIAKAGGMNSLHVHLETRIWRNGTYLITDPYQTLTKALYESGPIPPPPPVYAERLPIPQPGEWDAGAKVTITRDGVPLLQRARTDALPVASPWEEGDFFEAVMLVYTPDENAWYWVSRAGTRVPLQGTRSELLGDR